MPRRRKPSTVAPLPDMSRRWRTALADAELTEKAWAESQGLTPTHVSEVVHNGRRADETLQRAIDFVLVRERLMAKRIAKSAKMTAA